MRAPANKWRYIDPLELTKRISDASKEGNEEPEFRPVRMRNDRETSVARRIAALTSDSQTERTRKRYEAIKAERAEIEKKVNSFDERRKQGKLWG